MKGNMCRQHCRKTITLTAQTVGKQCLTFLWKESTVAADCITTDAEAISNKR